jgi:hypothetical protein
MAYSLNLYQRLVGPTAIDGRAYHDDLTAQAEDYERTITRIGGADVGEFTLTPRTMSRAAMDRFFSTMLGCRFVESTAGRTTWEGFILEMRYNVGGVQHMMSLRKKYFHNAITVYYSSGIGERASVTDSDTDSQDILGKHEIITSMGGATAAGATALAAAEIADYGWPAPRVVGSARINRERPLAVERELEVIVAGYWHTLNWLSRNTTQTDTASALMSSLLDTTDGFVGAGRIETNSTSLRVDMYPNPRYIGDLLTEVVEQGDSSGNLYRAGVLADRDLYYEQMDEDWRYRFRGGVLEGRHGDMPQFTEIQAGELVYFVDMPPQSMWPASGDKYKGNTGYIEEVEFKAGGDGADSLKLKFSDSEESLLITDWIRRGNVL